MPDCLRAGRRPRRPSRARRSASGVARSYVSVSVNADMRGCYSASRSCSRSCVTSARRYSGCWNVALHHLRRQPEWSYYRTCRSWGRSRARSLKSCRAMPWIDVREAPYKKQPVTPYCGVSGHSPQNLAVSDIYQKIYRGAGRYLTMSEDVPMRTKSRRIGRRSASAGVPVTDEG